jgi:hypothetical protein
MTAAAVYGFATILIMALAVAVEWPRLAAAIIGGLVIAGFLALALHCNTGSFDPYQKPEEALE